MNRARRSGYILVETAVALVLLSVGSYAVHRTIQEAIRTRGQAQDFTRARFLLEQKMSELLAQPVLTAQQKSGVFSGDDSRFAWTTDVHRVDLPLPPAPLRPRRDGSTTPKFEYPEGFEYLVHVRAGITWTRSGQEFSHQYETLLSPDRLWQPPRRRSGR